MEDAVESFSMENAEHHFSNMYLLLRKSVVQRYLGMDLFDDSCDIQTPVPKTHLGALTNFVQWVFGAQHQPSLFTDPGYLDKFGEILESPQAVQYLEYSENPNFDHAFQLAAVDESKLVQLLIEAAANLKLALPSAHYCKDSQEIQRAIERLAIDCKQLFKQFPNLQEKFLKEHQVLEFLISKSS